MTGFLIILISDLRNNIFSKMKRHSYLGLQTKHNKFFREEGTTPQPHFSRKPILEERTVLMHSSVLSIFPSFLLHNLHTTHKRSLIASTCYNSSRCFDSDSNIFPINIQCFMSVCSESCLTYLSSLCE